jgi:hypothetical protein
MQAQVGFAVHVDEFDAGMCAFDPFDFGCVDGQGFALIRKKESECHLLILQQRFIRFK